MSKKLIYLFSFALWLGLVLTSAAEAADPSLVLYLPFHEGTGEPKDFSVYEHGVELVNNPDWVDGKYGKALEFDGTNYVRVPINETLQFGPDQVERGDNGWLLPYHLPQTGRILH